MKKIGVAIIGPGNIGSDLMFKVFRSRNLEMKLMTGRKLSAGIQRASQLGIETTIDGVDGLLARKDELGIQIVFDATSASAHLANAPKLKEAGLYTLDLTPAAVGPYLVPSVNSEHLDEGACVYFVHSFSAQGCDPAHVIAATDYGCSVVAAVQNGNFYGCQFHPEKSGDVGLQILQNFGAMNR